ncbi:TPA: hypothetical protein QEM39_003218 [Pseudomonas putida]|uniref:hypothetical protein n=1 Tax=Pseudomonas putida TaxID=303 RepID=UPI0023645052|nr:hypothetical protein [Pseudomonas putida]MDD2151111.1 hypothetical protein [Pseudomonas putida]HDS1681662.1 hypothetical protein [Pseudomonas putida]
MRTIPLSLALATLVTATGTFAQSVRQPWDNEPSEFLGVPFQGDFKAQVPECPDSNGSSRQPTLCRTSTADPDRYEIHGLPYLPISSGYQLFAALKDGAISQLMLTGNSNSLELVDDFLTDTLGQPGSSLSRRIQLSSGASYEMKTISWEGKRVAVHFQRNESDLSRYTVTFTPSAADLKTLGMNSAAGTPPGQSPVR